MKKVSVFGFFILVFVLCGAMFSNSPSQALDNHLNEQIVAFNELMEADELQVLNWRSRVKSSAIEMNDDFQKYVDVFKLEHPSFTLASSEVNGDHEIAVFIHTTQDGLREEVKFFASKNTGGIVLEKSYELIADKAGQTFNRDNLENRLNELEINPAMFFYQITAETDLHARSLPEKAREYAKRLGAEEMEALIEETFISLSAYNSEWSEGITLHDNKTMNVQIALRQNADLGSRTIVTFGTPIITTEY
ncbi:hypothetical protein JCM19046_1256 [Bacillus sp. JCM 19046]|nr:hypothetical protein JCM19045_2019 [Bacillus sp. JCM 19045]GAF16795.1 hypothetical protein JCM19046_1256 [Bacillus sp. JCM 19046]